MRITAMLSVMLLIGCNGGGTCPVATEGCECTGAGLCDPPYTCQGGVCVDPTADTGTDAPADTGTDTTTDTAADDADAPTNCTSDGDCDDGNPCTTDTCDLDYNECHHDPVDADGDGYPAERVVATECGGTDCQDDNADVYPGTAMVACSPLDNDCNGSADEDQDGDGHVDFACGGDDCVDADVTTILGECAGVNDCCDGCWQRNGCWVDPTTGYMWANPSMGGLRASLEAIDYCAALSLAGHGAGEWHLPTISEMRTLVRGCPATEDGGACGVTDSCLGYPCLHDCDGCAGESGPGAAGAYLDPALEFVDFQEVWSSSEHETIPSEHWAMIFQSGGVFMENQDMEIEFRCVDATP